MMRVVYYQEEEETNISDIIDRLGDEDEDDVIDERMEMDIAPGNIGSSHFLDTDPAVTAFKAVQDILGKEPVILYIDRESRQIRFSANDIIAWLSRY